jgi:Protein of unknown function (DUF3987)
LTDIAGERAGARTRDPLIKRYTIDRQRALEPIVIPHLSIAVLGGVQPDKLDLITGGADDGFAARFFWFWPDPVRGFHLAREAIDSTRQHEALRRLHGMTMTQSEDGGLKPSYVS